jgi:hypothetical protein
MSKERYNQIIDEVYESYLKGGDIKWLKQVEVSSTPLVNMVIPVPYSKNEFIDKCKTDQEFSEKWGLKVEEQMLSEERRYNIWFNNNYETGMERFFNPEQLPDYDNPYYTSTPTKEITITYNGEKISFYE